ncbi:hypothetical protein C2E23DRAFT_890024 [Lenzites betulinus]|nr:hypothetical protein C2E23DRAFT_890024 [Lenzites betulinus]
MSPTCTIPYEVLLEFSNDTSDAATMQVLRRDSGSGGGPQGAPGQAGPVIFLHQGESISLVLTAGVAYKYAIRQQLREADLSVKIWSDAQCRLSDVFRAPTTAHCGKFDEGVALTEGITATPKTSSSGLAHRQAPRSQYGRR